MNPDDVAAELVGKGCFVFRPLVCFDFGDQLGPNDGAGQETGSCDRCEGSFALLGRFQGDVGDILLVAVSDSYRMLNGQFPADPLL